MRPTAALALVLSLQGLEIAVPPQFAAPLSSTARAQTASRTAWTEPYASALEAQTNLVLRATPLDATLTRIELAQWLAEFFSYIPNQQQRLPIADMEQNSPDYWTAQAVLQAGIMRSFEGNQFRPQGDLTKLEALAILVRALQIPAPTDGEIDRWMALYSDRAAVPEIGHPFIVMAGQAEILVNHPDPARIDPNVILTRGEGVVMLHRVLTFTQQVRELAPPVAQLSPAPLPRPEIAAVSVSPRQGRVAPGETFTIVVEGSPNANGSVLLAGALEQPLVEVEPGVYRAVFIPSDRDFLASPSVAVQLQLNGEVSRRQRIFPDLTLGNTFTSGSNTNRGNNRGGNNNNSAPPPIAANPNRNASPNRPSRGNPAIPGAANPSLTAIRYTPPPQPLPRGHFYGRDSGRPRRRRQFRSPRGSFRLAHARGATGDLRRYLRGRN